MQRTLKREVEKLMKFQQTDSNDEPSTISIKKDLHTLLRLAFQNKGHHPCPTPHFPYHLFLFLKF